MSPYFYITTGVFQNPLADSQPKSWYILEYNHYGKTFYVFLVIIQNDKKREKPDESQRCVVLMV